jgi:putative addiction module component (TIGR02574 family)
VEISQFFVAERIRLAEDLWNNILEHSDELPLIDAQKQEGDRRLERYQRDPTAGSSWEAVFIRKPTTNGTP